MTNSTLSICWIILGFVLNGRWWVRPFNWFPMRDSYSHPLGYLIVTSLMINTVWKPTGWKGVFSHPCYVIFILSSRCNLSCQVYTSNTIICMCMIVEHAIISYPLDPIILGFIEFHQHRLVARLVVPRRTGHGN